MFWLSHLEQSNGDVEESAVKVLALLSSEKRLHWIRAPSLMEAVGKRVVVLQECARLFAVRPSSCVVVQKLTDTRPIRESWRWRANGKGSR